MWNMITFNHFMNYSNDLLESPIFYKRYLASTAITVGVSLPLEIASIAQNTFKLVGEAFFMAVKVVIKITIVIEFSKSLRTFERKLPGPFALIQTIGKIFAYIIGSLSTATLGIFLPSVNFQFHLSLGILRDEKIEAALLEEQTEADYHREQLQIKLRQSIRERLQDLIKAKNTSPHESQNIPNGKEIVSTESVFAERGRESPQQLQVD